MWISFWLDRYYAWATKKQLSGGGILLWEIKEEVGGITTSRDYGNLRRVDEVKKVTKG